MSVAVDLIPGDILILIMQYLSAADLAAIAGTCRTWYDLVSCKLHCCGGDISNSTADMSDR